MNEQVPSKDVVARLRAVIARHGELGFTSCVVTDEDLRVLLDAVDSASKDPICTCPRDRPVTEGHADECPRKLRRTHEPAPALRPDGMPEPSLELLKRVAARMGETAPDTAYLAQWAVEQIEELLAIARASRNVCAYDWSDNDDDAVATMDRLHAVIGPWLSRSTSTKAPEPPKAEAENPCIAGYWFCTNCQLCNSETIHHTSCPTCGSLRPTSGEEVR